MGERATCCIEFSFNNFSHHGSLLEEFHGLRRRASPREVEFRQSQVLVRLWMPVNANSLQVRELLTHSSQESIVDVVIQAS